MLFCSFSSPHIACSVWTGHMYRPILAMAIHLIRWMWTIWHQRHRPPRGTRHHCHLIEVTVTRAIGIFRVTASRFMMTPETMWVAAETNALVHVKILSFVIRCRRPVWIHTYDRRCRTGQPCLPRSSTIIDADGKNERGAEEQCVTLRMGIWYTKHFVTTL